MTKCKYVFLGDYNSINIELINKSFNFIKNKVQYILIGELVDLKRYLIKINSNLEINEVLNPFDFINLDSDKLNLFDTSHLKNKKNKVLTQLNFCNFLCNKTNYDLVTMPINKSNIKKDFYFNGVTEYLGAINKKKTIMLMLGEKFSIIPVTTHIPLSNVSKNLKKKIINFIIEFNKNINDKSYLNKFKNFIFLCINPHCSENGTLCNDDIIIKKSVKKYLKYKTSFLPADSAFVNIKKNSLFISLYHDQALIPFKLLNKKTINLTLGLNYRRLSPAHGVARDIKFKNLADNRSFLECMLL